MNIGAINTSPNFSALYIEKDGMGRTASELADSLLSGLEYEKVVNLLDEKGVDIVIMPDPDNSEDRAKIIFADMDNRLYKIDGKDHLKTGKNYDLRTRTAEYYDNISKVIETAYKILKGEITAETTRPTKTQRALVEKFRVRDSMLEEKIIPDNPCLELFDDDIDYNCPEYQEYGNIDFEA